MPSAIAARLSHALLCRPFQRHHKLRKEEPGAVSILHQRLRALHAREYLALGQQGVRRVSASGQLHAFCGVIFDEFDAHDALLLQNNCNGNNVRFEL
jgi:hypothetical protein